jgi:hypothetical protein|mmetsp:Transcript_41062/g.68981  ORF Transcript_41062/g.68981 Transcript_41062/m.68981 type:complete len:217 (-) Transcript_41062:346-996(-)
MRKGRKGSHGQAAEATYPVTWRWCQRDKTQGCVFGAESGQLLRMPACGVPLIVASLMMPTQFFDLYTYGQSEACKMQRWMFFGTFPASFMQPGDPACHPLSQVEFLQPGTLAPHETGFGLGYHGRRDLRVAKRAPTRVSATVPLVCKETGPLALGGYNVQHAVFSTHTSPRRVIQTLFLWPPPIFALTMGAARSPATVMHSNGTVFSQTSFFSPSA